jgi:hypothetical protein
VIAYHKAVDSTRSDIWVNLNFKTDASHNLNVSSSDEPSKYAHVVFELHNDTIPVLHTIWTEALTAGYHEVSYRRWDLTQEGGGNEMSADIFDPNITPDLLAPRPNPFYNTTSIRYAVNTAGPTSVKVFDLTGRTVRTLTNANHRPGHYSLTWNRNDDRGKKLSEGVYFIRLSSPNCEKTRKVVVAE